MAEPTWLAKARTYVGLSEIPGKRTNTTIAGWLSKLKAPWKDDETAWCGTFVAAVLQASGLVPVKGWAGARNWLDYGRPIDRPAYGCIVVFWRGQKKGWSGHVGFVVGKDKNDNLMVIGGNQGNKVSIKAFPRARVLGYEWPSIAPLPERYDLPLLDSDGSLSGDEA